jgi:hypothetical protein
MKRFLLAVTCLVCALAVAVPASSAVLGLEFLVGTVEPAVPADPSDELTYSNNLITFWNGGADPSGGGYTYDVTIAGAGGSVPTPLDLATGGVQFDAGDVSGLDLTGYTYVFAKFGQDGALYYLDGSITSLDGFDPAWGPFTQQGGGLSHVTLFGPGTTRVPEAGTLMLLGFGLAGVGTLRRFIKR